jgi:hypothetical protein
VFQSRKGITQIDCSRLLHFGISPLEITELPVTLGTTVPSGKFGGIQAQGVGKIGEGLLWLVPLEPERTTEPMRLRQTFGG